jgi:hypothetical protein
MAAIFPIFNGDTALLRVSDVTSGITRAVAEKSMGSSTSRALTEMVSQTGGSAIARSLSGADDMIPYVGDYVSGSGYGNGIMKSVWTGAVTGSADWLMGRGSGGAKRWVTPILTDGVSQVLTMGATGGGDPRIF